MPSITLTFTSANATRIAKAFQETLNLSAQAPPAVVKEYCMEKIKQIVRSSEKRVAVEAANPNPDDVVVT